MTDKYFGYIVLYGDEDAEDDERSGYFYHEKGSDAVKEMNRRTKEMQAGIKTYTACLDDPSKNHVHCKKFIALYENYLKTIHVEKHELSKKQWKKMTEGRHRREYQRAASDWVKANLKNADVIKVASGRSPFKIVHEINDDSIVCRALWGARDKWFNAHTQKYEDPVADVICGKLKFQITNNYSENSASSIKEVWRDGVWMNFKKLVNYQGGDK